MKRIFFIFAFLSLAFCAQAFAQNVHTAYSYEYNQPTVPFSKQPVLLTRPKLVYSDLARMNQVEGSVKLSMTLAENSQVKDIQILSRLPHGVTEEAVKASQGIQFQPALDLQGRPMAMTLVVTYTVALVYREQDVDIKKAVILEKPAPVYPDKHKAAKTRGTVHVDVILASDKTVYVSYASTFLPKEFEAAAIEAAKRIRFEPAVHKLLGKPVSTVATIEYEFKP